MAPSGLCSCPNAVSLPQHAAIVLTAMALPPRSCKERGAPPAHIAPFGLRCLHQCASSFDAAHCDVT
eukprot:12681893-Alexandrium_andersonii.AAC.1